MPERSIVGRKLIGLRLVYIDSFGAACRESRQEQLAPAFCSNSLDSESHPSEGAGEMSRARTRINAGRLNQRRRRGVCNSDMVAM